MVGIESLLWQAMLADQQAAKEARKKQQDLVWTYYLGDTEALTRAAYVNLPVGTAIGNINITRRVIDRTSLVNMVPPERKIGDDDPKQDVYNELTRGKDFKMQRAERLANLFKLVVIHPTFRSGRLEYDLIRDFEPMFAESDPLTPIGICYPLAMSASVQDTDPVKWASWTATEYTTYQVGTDGPTNIVTQPHDLGLLPFVFVHADGVPESTFTDVVPALDLVAANYAVNLMDTDMHLNIRFQSFGNYWAKGVPTDQDIPLTPHDVTCFTEADAGMYCVTPPDTTESVALGIKFDITAVAQTYHLNAAFVEGTQSESGVALKVRNQELHEHRRSDVARARMVEEEVYVIERKILEVNGKGIFPEGFVVDFHESVDVMSAQERREQDQWDLDHNHTTEARLMQRDNPDKYKTIEEYQEEIDENKRLNSSPVSTPIAPPPGGITTLLGGASV